MWCSETNMEVAWYPVLLPMLLAHYVDVLVEYLLMFCLKGGRKLSSCGDVYDISISKKAKELRRSLCFNTVLSK